MGVKLLCTNDQFSELNHKCLGARQSSKFVSVEREALHNLLLDHTTVIGELEQYVGRIE